MACRYLVFILFLSVASGYRQLTSEEYYSTPDFYHIDDYYRCTSLKEGVYCVGQFVLHPIHENNEIYALIQDINENPHNHNHSITHQGICLTTTCAHIKHPNNTYRFEKCVNEWANTYDMTTTFKEFFYCHTSHDLMKPPELDTPKIIFLIACAILVVMNIAGTLHDYSTRGDVSKRNKFLMAWSVPVNWNKVAELFNHKDPRKKNLEAIQGLRFTVMFILIFSHVVFMLYQTGVLNYHFVEYMHEFWWLGNYLRGVSPVVQLFFILTSFLITYSHLISGTKITMSQIPDNLIKRLIRTAPVNILVVGFAATWWVDIAQGPNWPVFVNAESQICRNKFWAQAFFLNNFIDVDNQCLLQTWFVAADLQIYIVFSILLVLLLNSKLTIKSCMYVVGGLMMANYVLIYVLAYKYSFKPLEYVCTTETLYTLLKGKPSFTDNYIVPWTSFPACLMGILVAYLLHHIQQTGFKLEEQKWFVVLYHWSLPIVVVFWPLAGGTHSEPFQSPYVVALYLVLERAVAVFFYGIFILGLSYGIDSPIRSVFSWYIWQLIAKVSFGYMMIHWCVISFFIRGSLSPVFTISSGAGHVTTGLVLSLLCAVPVTVFVEVPMQRFLNLVIFNNDK